MTQAAILAANSSLMTAPSGTAPAYQCRAWVNFNGTGTVAIRASGNVSSITDGGTGRYEVNFSTAMPDTNFVVSGTSTPEVDTGGAGARFLSAGGPYFGWIGRTTTSVKVLVAYSSADASDGTNVNVAIFR